MRLEYRRRTSYSTIVYDANLQWQNIQYFEWDFYSFYYTYWNLLLVNVPFLLEAFCYLESRLWEVLNIFLTDAFIKSVFYRCNVLRMKYLCSKFRNLIKLNFIQFLFARRTRTEPYDWRSLRRSPFLPQILATTWTLMALPLWCLPNYCLHPLRTQGWHGTTSTNRGKIDWQYCQLYSIFKHVLAIISYL